MLKTIVNDLSAFREQLMLYDWGNMSQRISAGSAVVFGFASVFTAAGVYGLQTQNLKDAELGRTTDLLVKYQTSYSKYDADWFHAAACMNYLTEVGQSPDFDDKMRHSHDYKYLFDKALLEISPKSENLRDCVTNPTDKQNEFETFVRRLNFALGGLELVLTQWGRYKSKESPVEIDNEIHSSACSEPAKLFRVAKGVAILNDNLRFRDFRQLAKYIDEMCR